MNGSDRYATQGFIMDFFYCGTDKISLVRNTVSMFLHKHTVMESTLFTTC